MNREQLAKLRERPNARVLIVGGGINGVATFRYLAMQGIDVALVERGDYCQGASGASSHMIHGGIRYLENGEFRLVHESVQERNSLLQIAPHYVKPLQTTIPIFSTFSGILSAPLRFVTHKSGKPTERGAALIKAGLVMYDVFAGIGGRNTPWHNFKAGKAARRDLPQLREDVKYTATYFDASVHNPERLTLDVLREGLRANPEARASNYVELAGIDGGTAQLRDVLTGEGFDFDAEVIINATGAWVDETNKQLGRDTRWTGGTKGSHIVLDHPELLAATGGREIFFEHEDGRIVLIYPMLGRVLVGTTDLEHDMAEPAVCTEEEVDYFFELVRHVFPRITVRREQIVYKFSGVRPLPNHDDTAPGFVSRDYQVRETRLTDTTTMLSLIGGKWTTFRALSENLGSKALEFLGEREIRSTAGVAIGGGRDFPMNEGELAAWYAARESIAGRDRLRVLLERYGTGADAVLEQLGEDTLLQHSGELSRQELAYMAAHEQVGRLIDVFIRRTNLAFRGLVTKDLVSEAGHCLAEPMGWDETRTQAEIAHTISVLAGSHGVVLD
ncbi:glycerol-3-phosphate dehydrogenase/oxidase [Glutamicibacter protophormiae]|uniref:glycerol-3-phosphate dehydrogenase/oxidase n=1 Tax=Glutamicibacter protophormiae TaxID=37930 RepID=UPI002A80E973|nr:glycerol-3-phosphate dehydrogenase/oxidase [Glutamicibacter protophormiae]WPR66408.1 glycerol-3-phosphate dehydrogenase/oxidase [Glutamicibacter protophormiae]WPR69904.1 glycerol-3-phosphate dehydrogenase/oxidase [Glutamicibacter protophormiae]